MWDCYKQLERVTKKWEKDYPNAMKSWHTNWDVISPIFKFSAEVRKVIYTTNAIESLKERGYYSVGLDGGGDALVGETGFETDPLVVVLGSEGNGLSRLVREACD